MGKPSFSSQRFDKDHFILDFFDNEFSKMEISVFSESKNMFLADQGDMTSQENKWKINPEYPEQPLTSKMILEFNDAFLYSLNMLSKYAPFQVFVYLNGVKQDHVLIVSNPRFPSSNLSLDIQNGVGILRFFDGKIIRKRVDSNNDSEERTDGTLIQPESVSDVSDNSTAQKDVTGEASDNSNQQDKEKSSSNEIIKNSTEFDSSEETRMIHASLLLDNDSRFDTSFDSEQYRYVPPNFYKIVMPFVFALLLLVVMIVAVYYFGH